ncbi:hypothetical protein B0T26DRAFT_672232 [Lasiosphaeria miniovina]|uniref:Uncharacterized protein n=1 Tax=Lasiosphaeria miniovina TaxID=1954250 RepID=A0AA40B4R2_9PEZI|nr:uncharacterized protein B0T26DRAFT_672232 [Lasiosphaeria miniovina]KAK0727587.1 hypothetical protein B0T26DRAFT_672232 [Lasiosphaeria miniovina]
MAEMTLRYLIDDTASSQGPPRRISCDELVPIMVDNGLQPTLPNTVRTVPLPVACAAFVRMAAREKRASRLRTRIFEQLSSVITHSLFDMSYEGDYMEFPPND